jgi:hypothetical protein
MAQTPPPLPTMWEIRQERAVGHAQRDWSTDWPCVTCWGEGCLECARTGCISREEFYAWYSGLERAYLRQQKAHTRQLTDEACNRPTNPYQFDLRWLRHRFRNHQDS